MENKTASNGTDESDQKKKLMSLDEEEKELISKWKNKRKRKESPIHMKSVDGKLDIDMTDSRGSETDKVNLFHAIISEATGSGNMPFALSLLQQYVSVVFDNPVSKDYTGDCNIFIDSMLSLSPQDEMEGMLLTQVLSLQVIAMKYASRAANPDNIPLQVDRNVNNLTKLLRLQHETIETLNRYRRKGTQQVVVQHVTVNQGGKAVVGAIQQSGDRGGHIENGGSTP